MEALDAFFASDAGSIAALAFIFVGLADIIVVCLPALPLAKKRLELQHALLHTHQPEEKAKIKQQLQAQNIVFKMQVIFGVLIALVGVYGLTR